MARAGGPSTTSIAAQRQVVDGGPSPAMTGSVNPYAAWYECQTIAWGPVGISRPEPSAPAASPALAIVTGPRPSRPPKQVPPSRTILDLGPSIILRPSSLAARHGGQTVAWGPVRISRSEPSAPAASPARIIMAGAPTRASAQAGAAVASHPRPRRVDNPPGPAARRQGAVADCCMGSCREFPIRAVRSTRRPPQPGSSRPGRSHPPLHGPLSARSADATLRANPGAHRLRRRRRVTVHGACHRALDPRGGSRVARAAPRAAPHGASIATTGAALEWHAHAVAACLGWDRHGEARCPRFAGTAANAVAPDPDAPTILTLHDIGSRFCCAARCTAVGRPRRKSTASESTLCGHRRRTLAPPVQAHTSATVRGTVAGQFAMAPPQTAGRPRRTRAAR
jgi:hypothetical protein